MKGIATQSRYSRLLLYFPWALTTADGSMFDLTQILHFMPFLMHLSRLGTGTMSTLACEPPMLD